VPSAARFPGSQAPSDTGQVTPPVVVTQYGVLQGKTNCIRGIPVNVYLGVPFAKPPLGSLRFAPPQPPEPWEGVRQATTYPNSCLQESWGQIASMIFTNRRNYVWLKFGEDCLYLNVYSPAHANRRSKLPVMVWFPGGAFLVGAASTYDGAWLSAFEDVVVVIIQYRLGVFGFLSTGDVHARGNWGLLDQVAALQWIQENIEGFGGDPGCVTAFGQSAGGISISALMLSPLSRGLFHRAISQSGTALIKPFITYRPLELAKKIAKVAGCDNSSSSDLVQCLREKPERQLVKASRKMKFFRIDVDPDPNKIIWFVSPVVDGVVFPVSPEELLARGDFLRIPYLLGVNNQDFGWLLPHVMKYHIPLLGLKRDKIYYLIWKSSQLLNITEEQVPVIMKEYLGNIQNKIVLRNLILDLATDGSFVVTSVETARYHRDAGLPVYFYQFQHHASSGILVKPCYVKADHGDEIGFIFGRPFSQGDEICLSVTMMKYWVNFARTGNPNGGNLTSWPPYDQEEKYLAIDLNQKVAAKLREKQVEFWIKIQNPPRKTPTKSKEFTELEGHMTEGLNECREKNWFTIGHLGTEFCQGERQRGGD
uniref:Carboxylesterase 4A n=1 Tax=Ornithorhynchus anatinus TaxID=9258 RepID=A0A6I8P6K3_ORNAN